MRRWLPALLLLFAACDDGGTTGADAAAIIPAIDGAVLQDVTGDFLIDAAPDSPDAGPCDGPEDCNGAVCCSTGQGSICVADEASCTGLPLCHAGPDCSSGVCCPQGFCGPGCD